MQENCPIQEPDAIYAIAYEFYSHGHYKEASSLFSHLVIQETKNVSYWMGLGASLQMQKEYLKALDAYTAAAILEVEERDPLPHFYAAQCLIVLKDVKSALQALESASTIASKDSKYEQLLIQINLIKDAWSTKCQK